VFALAGVPPFAGFMGKLTLLKAALTKGHLVLVIVAVLNSAVAIYYYLGLVREAYFREVEAVEPIRLGWAVRGACVGLMLLVLGLGIVPSRVLGMIDRAVAQATERGPAGASGVKGAVVLEGMGGGGAGMGLVKGR
jgi:NADH-quinone oxidoreductase subunit N